MVRKDVLMAHEWHDKRFWQGDVPTEVLFSHRLAATGSEYILPFVNWSIDRSARRCTIYTGFAEFGSLFSLKQVKNDRGRMIYHPVNGHPIPSP